MSKKDIIFVALLMNIAVLSILIAFASSGSTPHQESKSVIVSVEDQTSSIQKGVEISSPVLKKNSSSSLDEIDALLEEYLPPDTTLVEGEKKEPSPVVVPETPVVAPKAVKVKSSEKPQVPLRPKKVVEVQDQSKMYTIQPGDNPWKIAKKFHISFEKLLELNHLNEAKAKNLKVGQKLRIQE